MKAFVVFAALFVAAQAADNSCSRDVTSACKNVWGKQSPPEVDSCNSKYGAIEAVLPDLQAYVNTHITRSFEYLLMSTHYANYEQNRAGFEKVLRDLSNDKWSTAIELIKYIGKRGGQMNFAERKAEQNLTTAEYQLYELQTMAKALDMEKELAKEAHHIHRQALRKHDNFHDPEISSYIEEEFVHKHAGNVRKLAGYTNDLLQILDGPERSLGLYFFDDYLQKQ